MDLWTLPLLLVNSRPKFFGPYFMTRLWQHTARNRIILIWHNSACSACLEYSRFTAGLFWYDTIQRILHVLDTRDNRDVYSHITTLTWNKRKTLKWNNRSI